MSRHQSFSEFLGDKSDSQHLVRNRSDWWVEPSKGDDEAGGAEEALARARSLYDTVRGLEDSQRQAHEQHLWNARLYSNRELVNFDWGHSGYSVGSLAPVSLLGENLVLSVVDTIVSIVGKSRVKPTPTPRGASYKTHRNARKLDKWLYGEFTRLKVYRLLLQLLTDGLVFGFGALRVDCDEGKLSIRRVFPDDFIVDQAESVSTYGVKHVYERRCRPVEEVEQEYGLKPGTLKGEDMWLSYRRPGRGWVVVVEGYRPACGGLPGRHVVATDQALLLDEVWKEEHTPYLTFHPHQPLSGFYGPSIVERVLPYQVRLNEINEVIRDAQDIMARPRILVAEGSRVNPADIDNVIGRILKYTGVKPEALTWDAVSPELYAERDHQVRSCQEQFGLSSLVMSGKLPGQARLDSSAALQEATAISDDRLSTMLQRWEEFHLDVADLLIKTMRASGKDAETTWSAGGRKRAETIKWSEIDLENDAYVMTLEASSIFGMTPAARRDKVETWFAQGKITIEQLWELEQNPDLESFVSEEAASKRSILKAIEDLEDGKNVVPDPMQDLVTGVRCVTYAYLRLRDDFDDVPTAVLEGFIKWVALARAIMQQGTQTPNNQGLGREPQTAPPPAPMTGAMGPGIATMGAGPMTGGAPPMAS